jgi:5-methylcytosine-specific restriction endonuclease McrA
MASQRCSGSRWRALRLLILRRDGYVCQMVDGCTTPADTIDHWIPYCDGGTDTPMNLRAACAHHNYAAGAAIGGNRRTPTDERPLFDWTSKTADN